MKILHPDKITLESIQDILTSASPIALSEIAIERILRCRQYLEEKIEFEDQAIYGVNTGFGALCDERISNSDLEKLQENLLMSHACGTGDEAPKELVRMMILLKIHALALGHSGVQLQTVQRLIDFLNEDIIPVVFTQGSLGASGDLSPLAHLSLPLIGKGEVFYKNEKRLASEVLEETGLQPIRLKSKEGLALLNGTQFMSAYGVYCIQKSRELINTANHIACMSLDAFDCKFDSFNLHIQQVRPHRGQVKVAESIRRIISDSEIIQQEKIHVQDPYSFRCIPQVHGATDDTIEYVAQTFLTEINSVTDNPTLFPKEDMVLSAGNFHGQPLALGLDFLAIAMAELGNISERRTYQLISGQRDLPAFLISNPGLHSGLMIPQYTAASIVSQNKQLSTPSSIDSIVSSNGQEDHVSMGANAAVKLLKIIENIERILAIELLTATQALEFRRPLTSSDIVENLFATFRKHVPMITEDRMLYKDIEKSIAFVKNGIKNTLEA